jgi:dienelactone hydrolase
MKRLLCAIAIAAASVASAFAQQDFPRDSAATIEVIPFATRTLSDEAFRAGDRSAGEATEIAGVLRLPLGQGPFPVVVLIEGSGGIGSNFDHWDRQFLAHGVATFTIDGFTGRGIASLVADQSKLGLMNMIVDLYRGLGALARQPRIDPARVAVMGFSRGGLIALYAAMKRFQTAWNDSGVTPTAYIPLYPVCNFQFLDDADVGGGPIRIFHGAADDYVPIAPCEAYVQRLSQAGRDVAITALPDAYHAYDMTVLPSPAMFLPNAQKTDCLIVEDKSGALLDSATGKPWTGADACNGLGAHIGYSAAATATTDKAVLDFLTARFKLRSK